MNGVLLLAFLWVLKAFLEVMLVIVDHLLLLFFLIFMPLLLTFEQPNAY